MLLDEAETVALTLVLARMATSSDDGALEVAAFKGPACSSVKG